VSEWTFRLAMPEDAEAFSLWVAENPLIDPQDVRDGLNQNNPTTLTFVACLDGKPIWFAPVYLVAHLAHLGVNPEAKVETRKQGLERLMAYVGLFMCQIGIRQITTLTKEKYPIARWAKQRGFKIDPRQLLKWDLGEWMKGK
jgi:hypothetical protein